MKLTKEQELYIRNQIAFKTNHLVDEKVAEVVKLIEGMPEGQPELNTTRWYHCRERLPTVEDASDSGNVFVKRTNDTLDIINYRSSQLSSLGDMWWTPAPKNLVKPTPSDPFEEWWLSFRDSPFTKKDIAQRAYELGLSQPKQ